MTEAARKKVADFINAEEPETVIWDAERDRRHEHRGAFLGEGEHWARR